MYALDLKEGRTRFMIYGIANSIDTRSLQSNWEMFLKRKVHTFSSGFLRVPQKITHLNLRLLSKCQLHISVCVFDLYIDFRCRLI